jgi:uncharacterized protein (DUF1330 family)
LASRATWYATGLVVVTQIVYLYLGQEAVFDAFEAIALAAVERHGGELLLRLRPPPAATLAGSLAPPHEVHVVRFPGEDHLTRFMADPARAEVLHLKDASVREALVFRGS